MVTKTLEWTKRPLGELAHIKTGSRNNEEKNPLGRYPFFVRSAIVERIKTYSYDEEAILVPGEGNIGNIFHYIKGRFDAHQRVYVIDQFQEEIKPSYLYWYMKRFFGPHALKNTAKATVDSLRLPTFQSFKVRYPQPPEQRAIAEVLSGFDEHLANLDELIAKKKNIRDGALDAMFSGKKRMRGFQNPFLRTKLLEYSEVLTGLTYNPADVQTSGVLVLRSSNIQDDVISLEDTVFVRASAATSPSVQAGDVLLCVRNGSTRLIGKTAQISEDVPRGTTFGAFMAILRALPAIDPSYLYWFTKSSAFREQVREVLGATINQITKRDLAYFTISIPESIAEQKAIAEVLSSMDEEIRVLQAERLKVGVLKLGAMDDLLTGRVRLPVEEVDA